MENGDAGIRGKVIAITGASSGIGAATAILLAQRGAKVLLGARQIDRLNTIVSQITAAGGEACCTICDVTKREDLASLVQLARDKFGGLRGQQERGARDLRGAAPGVGPEPARRGDLAGLRAH